MTRWPSGPTGNVEHYGFLIAPCRRGTPEHKGKLGHGEVHYVKRNLLAGQAFRGQGIPGITKELPGERFTQVEQAALQPLPTDLYALTTWKKAKLHPDCHVVFAWSFYSAPHRLIGRAL
jgi:hypothetical protein